MQFARYFKELTNSTTYSIVNLNFIHPGHLHANFGEQSAD